MSVLSLGMLVGCSGGDETPEPTFTPPIFDTPVVPTDTPVKRATPTTGEARPTPGSPLEVHVNVDKHHTISPLIYGVADPTAGNEELLRWLRVTLTRWGGNARTRHNWEINASNAGSDYEFRNVSQGDGTPGSASLGFLQRNYRLGAESILTIPIIGWVARDGDENTRSVDVPEHGGPAIEKGTDTAYTEFKDDVWVKPYDPSANRARTSVQSLPAKGAPFAYPPDLTDGKVYQDEWVAYLKGNRPNEGAPPMYSMDNEPDLWADSTHVDVHPVRQGYDGMLNDFLTYARAVKAVDPGAMVMGPESWGVTGYVFSALDEGGDKFATAADRKVHGGAPFLQWFLGTVNTSDKAKGQRSLDILSVHYYPTAGQYEGGNEPEMQDKRVQAPRALWDGLYVEPSWVADTEWANLGLIRRLNGLIGQFYPGTKLCLTEWNFGGEDDISGAVATADALGIFGREKLYCAAYWGVPKEGSATGWAFRLYRNYDGEGASFGSEAVETNIGDTRTYSAYGALSKDGDKLTLVLINKDRAKSADLPIKLSGFTPKPSGRMFQYTAQNKSGLVEAPLNVSDPAELKVTVPAMSVTLVELEK